MSFGTPSAGAGVNPFDMPSKPTIASRISTLNRAVPSGTNLARGLTGAAKDILSAGSTPVTKKQQLREVSQLDIKTPDSIRVPATKGSLTKMPTLTSTAQPSVGGGGINAPTDSAAVVQPKSAVGAGTTAPTRRRRSRTILTGSRGVTQSATPRYSIVGGYR